MVEIGIGNVVFLCVLSYIYASFITKQPLPPIVCLNNPPLP